jgi:hypothetical protein
MNINQFLSLGVNGLLKGLCKMGHALSLEMKWNLGIMKVKMLKNQTNNHHVRKDTFEFIEDGDQRSTRSMFILKSIKKKLIFFLFM